MSARSASPSITAVNDTIPPPAKGSTISGTGVGRERSHLLACGTSQVLPPGYRRGLRCGTVATLTAGMDETLNGVIDPVSLFSENIPQKEDA